ncbi:HAD family phosphatase [Cohnella endophytica]|uniref:HAD family phosphatase n=1 Tax=Cohnella endophytica TaxID=2419778 RepID=A0A494XUM5_9BACL|nr:Cof-type HAD-IIB family hydrolase [Cohnella endophytica]RKP54323.1 HAD family phosphatase [Cohnella endophytica]
MSYRMIALDVDGTLLNDHHELTPRVREAVRSAEAQGAEIVLCTGRGSTSALPVLQELGLKGTMITHNGASVVDSETREILFDTAIAPDLALRYVAYCRERGIHFDMNTAFDLYVEAMEEEAEKMYRNLKAKPISRQSGEAFPQGLVKLSIYAPKLTLDRVETEWSEWEQELQFVRSGDNFIDVQHLHASKGKALERLAIMRGIPREQILALGNYYNDIGMITFAGWGVAMNNSPEEVKAEADDVTVSNNEDGVAVVIEQLVLV